MEYVVTLHTGNVRTVYPDLCSAKGLIEHYANEGRAFTFAPEPSLRSELPSAQEQEQQARLDLQLALATGKTIQRKDWAANRWCFAWVDVDPTDKLREPSTEYRIKP